MWTRFCRLMTRIGLVLGSLIAILLGYLFIGWPSVDPTTAYGVTWSNTYADYLGIDSQKGLEATLDDLGVRQFRIPAYWSSLEPSAAGKFQWDWLDKEMDAIAARHGSVILVVGAKQPRWPECWVPSWVRSLSDADRKQAQVDYVTQVVKRYRTHPALKGWQVENEPALAFGDCPNEQSDFIRSEMQLVKQLDSTHALSTTASGELSLWVDYTKNVDAVGVSVYRVVLAPVIGQIGYPFPSWFYRRKAQLVSPWVKNIYVSEFQMEPWVKGAIITEPLESQFNAFSLTRMKNNFLYAERLHMPSVYFWGVEWWYWMKTQKGHPEFWNEAKMFFSTHQM